MKQLLLRRCHPSLIHCTYLSIAGAHSPAPPSPRGPQSQPSAEILRITQGHFLPPVSLHALDKEHSSAIALAPHFCMNSLAKRKEKLLMCRAVNLKPKEREGRKLSFCTTAMQILTAGEGSAPAASAPSQSWEIKQCHGLQGLKLHVITEIQVFPSSCASKQENAGH